jgi:hypothetical protein
VARPVEFCGRLADDLGVARVRIDPESARALRVPVLRMLRRYGAGLDQAAETFTRLTGDGLTGTPAEMRLLAGRLDAVNAATRVDRPGPAR